MDSKKVTMDEFMEVLKDLRERLGNVHQLAHAGLGIACILRFGYMSGKLVYAIPISIGYAIMCVGLTVLIYVKDSDE